jgi:hypothetical protein
MVTVGVCWYQSQISDDTSVPAWLKSTRSHPMLDQFSVVYPVPGVADTRTHFVLVICRTTAPPVRLKVWSPAAAIAGLGVVFGAGELPGGSLAGALAAPPGGLPDAAPPGDGRPARDGPPGEDGLAEERAE